MVDRVIDRAIVMRAMRVVMAALWLGGTLWAAVVCLMIGVLDTATFFGEPPTDEMRREGTLFSLAGTVVAVGGPVGVWFLHRRRGWLYLAMALGIAAAGVGIYVAGLGLD